MKKLLYTLVVACLIFACAKTDQLVESSPIDALSEKYDDSNFGNYKGVFTTADSKARGVVDVTILDDLTFATLTMENATIHEFYSPDKISEGEDMEIDFYGDIGSFVFKVGSNGQGVELNEVTYNGGPGYVLAKKNTAKAPTSPVTGTYNCTNCGGSPITHPVFTSNSVSQTFSFVFTNGGTGSGDIETQIMYDGTPYNQSLAGDEGSDESVTGSCITSADAVTSDYVVTISGQSTVLSTVRWEGTHDFSRTGDSEIFGTWDFDYGGTMMTGEFFSSTDLFFEDFEDNKVSYSSSIAEFTDSGMGMSGGQDYFLRTDGSNISGESFTINHGGTFYFTAQDIDGEGAASQQTISYSGINICEKSNIMLSVFLAEDATGNSENWDTEDYFLIEYQIDGGGYNSLLAVQAAEPNGDDTNNEPRIDTNSDGIGDGKEITDAFTEFTEAIPGTGSTLDIRITMDLNDGGTDIAFDNIKVTGS